MRTIPTLLCAVALAFSTYQVNAWPVMTVDAERPGVLIHDLDRQQTKDSRVRLHIAPNPLVTRSTLEAGGALIQRVSIHDLHGRLVRLHENINDQRFTIERGQLTPGTYVVRVMTDRGPASIKLAVQ